ncbi:MAG TPA: sensor histidine kinase [Burkholderiales bacterium]|nr:sensor histidine kinase [Burkholderiales bacterium]
MDRTDQFYEQLTALALHLAERQPAILQRWRDAVERDPQLTTASALPRKQLNDHIPHVLDAFGHELRARGKNDRAEARQESQDDATAHGLHRWQQGYHLREVAREWAHLQLCLADELSSYTAGHPELMAGVMPTAYRALARVCGEGVSDSTDQYFEMQQVEAAGYVRDLEAALEQVRELERQRAELWREAAHDLRGKLGVVANATTGLTLADVAQPVRDNFLRLLKKNVSSLHTMLDDVMGLARLQAGHEQRDVKSIDASVLMRELCETLQPVAEARGLFLKLDGPPEFAVEADAVKLQRIVQNLLINALKYTEQGGVTVKWGDSRKNDAERWMLTVEDTGPGIHAGPGAPLAEALEEATEEARQVEITGDSARQREESKSAQAGSAQPDPRAVHQQRGEGIGLAIVKRLSELLDATVELTSEPDQGTTFRIVLPRHYASAQQKP